MAGRYVAFGQTVGEENPTGAVGINVVDLKQRKRVAGYRYTGGWDVEKIVLKASGGVAWAGSEPYDSATGAGTRMIAPLR